MIHPDPTPAALTGLWTRSLLQWPDGRRDTTTRVHWLQGPSLYADLRRPAARPAFDPTSTFETLTPAQLAWMVSQEGFAGRLQHHDGWFEWAREIDWQPPAAQADSGRLWWEGERLVEEGRAIPYIEHWHAEDCGLPASSVAARLADLEEGRHGVLVRSGARFMIARDRASTVPALSNLATCVAAAASRAAVTALLDCEISYGTIDAAGWRIRHSSLPWREAILLRPQRRDDILDLVEPSSGNRRRWHLLEIEGREALLDS